MLPGDYLSFKISHILHVLIFTCTNISKYVRSLKIYGHPNTSENQGGWKIGVLGDLSKGKHLPRAGLGWMKIGSRADRRQLYVFVASVEKKKENTKIRKIQLEKYF